MPDVEEIGGEPKAPVPYLEIFSKPRILISFALATFAAAKWHGFDPILEPELSRTVGHLVVPNLEHWNLRKNDS